MPPVGEGIPRAAATPNGSETSKKWQLLAVRKIWLNCFFFCAFRPQKLNSFNENSLLVGASALSDVTGGVDMSQCTITLSNKVRQCRIFSKEIRRVKCAISWRLIVSWLQASQIWAARIEHKHLQKSQNKFWTLTSPLPPCYHLGLSNLSTRIRME